MALNNLGLGLLLSAKDLASGVIEKVRDSFTGLDEKTNESQAQWDTNMALFTKGAVVMGAGVATLMTSYNLAEAAMPLESSLADTAARLDLTSDQVARLHDEVVRTSEVLPEITQTEAAQTMAELAVQTRDFDESLAKLVPSLELSHALEVSGAESAGILASTMKAFDIPTSAAKETTDQFVYSMKRFGIQGREMGMVTAQLARGGQTVGASFEDSMMLFGLARTQTASTQQALMATRMAMMQLASPAIQKKLTGLLGKGSVIDESTGKIRPLVDILQNVAQKTSGMTEAQRALKIQEIFGGRAAGGMSAALEAMSKGMKDANGNMVYGADVLKMLRGEWASTDGALERFQATREATAKGAMERAGAAYQKAKTALGEAFLPVFTKMYEVAAKVFGAIAEWVSSLPTGVKEFLGYLAVGVGVLLTFAGAVLMVKGAFGMIKTAWTALRAVMVAGPLGGVLLALTAIAAIAYLVIDNWDAVKAALGAAWDWLSSKADAAWTAIKETFYAAGRALESAFDAAVVHVLRALFWLRDQVQGIPLVGDVIRLGEDIIGGVTGGADATELDRMSRALTDAESLAEYDKNLAALPEGGGGMGTYAPAWGRAIGPEPAVVPTAPAYGATAYPAAASAEEEARRTMTPEQLQAALSTARPPPAARGPGDAQTINLQTQVLLDGEVLAQAMQKGIERSAQRAFEELVGGGGE